MRSFVADLEGLVDGLGLNDFGIVGHSLGAKVVLSYAGSHDVNQFLNPAAFKDPAPVATIGQTDFSPLGGPRSQVTGPPLRQLDSRAVGRG